MAFVAQTYTDPSEALTDLEARAAAEFTAIRALIVPATPEAWHVPTLQNSWANFGDAWRNAGYRKMPDGTVRLRGLLKGGTPPSVAFVLPAGYRPLGDIMYAAVSSDGVGRVDVNGDGSVWVRPPSTSTFVGIDHIAFVAEA